MVPETVEPDDGDVMLTVGGEVSLKTVTVTVPEVVVFPAASRARPGRGGGAVPGAVGVQGGGEGEPVSSAPGLGAAGLHWAPATATLAGALAVTGVAAGG